MTKIELSIIIVSYNTKVLLRNCLLSIYDKTKETAFEVIVVDNASCDGSAEMVRSEFPEAVVIENTENKGFSYANNRGLAAARGEYILFLNSDTKLAESVLKNMLDIAKDNILLGALGAALYTKEGDNRMQPCYGKFPSLFRLLRWQTFIGSIFPLKENDGCRDNSQESRVIKTDVVSGACFLVPRRVLDKVGVFDEKLFMYFEEFDLCRRIKKAGYDVYFYPKVKLVHFGNRSASNRLFLAKKERILKEASAYYIKKHHGYTAYLFFSFVIELSAIFKVGSYLKQ